MHVENITIDKYLPVDPFFKSIEPGPFRLTDTSPTQIKSIDPSIDFAYVIGRSKE